MEEGEEPVFTHAEETKRQIRREERKAKRTEEFKIAKETCQCMAFCCARPILICSFQSNRPDDPEAIGDPYKTLFISRLVASFRKSAHACTNFLCQHKTATETDLRREFEGYGTH